MSNSKQNPPISASIVLAAYQGEQYIQEQIDSIVAQMGKQDELIISIDPSADQTLSICQAIQQEYPSLDIKILEGSKQGLLKNFENGLKQASKEIIFLCDQDDQWLDNKLEVIKERFQNDPNLMAVVHDALICDANLNSIEPSFFAFHHSQEGYVKNIVRNSFIGCCMALKKEVVDLALPFVQPLPMHDQYLGLIAYKLGKVEFVKQQLVRYRRHGNNASSLQHASLGQQIKWRMQMIRAMHQIDQRIKTRSARENKV